jgi:hypothetical protein
LLQRQASKAVHKKQTINLLLLGLHVVEDHVQGRALLSEVSDDGDGAAHSLADGAVLSQLGKAAPLTDLGTGIGHDQVNAGLGAQSLDKLLVLLVVAVLGEDAQASTSTVKGLHAPNKYDGRKNKIKIDH